MVRRTFVYFGILSTVCLLWITCPVGSQNVITPDQFPVPPKQLSVKIEMVLPDDKFVEEFFMYWDEELNLARYDFALGRIAAPFNATRQMKTIHDFNNGIVFFIEGILSNCSMFPLGYLLTESNSTYISPFRIPKRFVNVGNLTLHHLLRTLHPRQLFFMDNTSRAINASMEMVRGIPCEVWNVTVNNYYVPGYGQYRTRHRLYLMSNEFTRYLVGEVPYRIPVQRIVTFLDARISFPIGRRNPGQTVFTDKIIFNFFDFTVPVVPTMYDFSISNCVVKQKVETRESFQIRFPGNYSGIRADQFIQPFRRNVLKRILQIGDLSPVRVVGMFFSKDEENLYITATILPQPAGVLHFTMTQNSVTANLRRGTQYFADRSNENAQISACASTCMKSQQGCSKFGWCRRENTLPAFPLRQCVERFDETLSGQAASSSNPQLQDILTGWNQSDVTTPYQCDVYQRIINSTTYDGGVVETLFNILLDIQENNFTITVDANGTVVALTAEDMRTDVTLQDDGSKTASSGTRTTFDFFRGHSSIANSAAKDSFSKLSPTECRQRCLDEKRFTCQSVASCAHGDCIISDLHGDELSNTTNGKSNMITHSHCAIWTRTWKGMFTLASLLVPRTPADAVVLGVSNEDTCAKQCLFGNMSCESFSFCSTLTTPAAMTLLKRPTKLQHECHLYKSHAFDIMHEMRDFKPGCWHLSRNYVNDFEASPGYELYDMNEGGFEEREIEPALERWHCAKECIDKLGDDGCLAFDVCEDIATTTDDLFATPETFNASAGSVKCRISSVYIGPTLTNTTKKVRSNENCTLYTRRTYLDGTLISPKTVTAYRRDAPLELPGDLLKLHAAVSSQQRGYTISDMIGLALGMLILGVVSSSVCCIILRRMPNGSGVTFVRDIPFVRFS